MKMRRSSNHRECETRLRRRTFLELIAGGLSFSVAALASRRLLAGPDESRPGRLLVFYLPHGMPVEHVEPLLPGGGLDESPIWSVLAEHNDVASILRGISMSDGATNHAAIRAMMTGVNEGGMEDSIDKKIADGLGVPAHVLGALPYSVASGFSVDSHLVRHGTWVRPTEDPAEAVSDLFAGVGQDPDMPDPNIAFRQAALGLSEGELERLSTRLGGLSSEKSKIDLHLEALRGLIEGGASGGLEPTCDGVPGLPSVAALAGLDVMDQANFAKVLDGHLEAAAQAFICGSARVVTLQNLWVNSDLNMAFEGGPGVPKGHHEPISHSWDAAGRAEFADVQRWFLSRLNERFLKVLAAVNDPIDPTNRVLDNTLVWICSEVSDGANHHSDTSSMWIDGTEMPTYLPNALIGGASGCLAPGVVDVTREHADVLATVAAMMGVPVDTIGGKAVTPIEEVMQ
jgi:hypothetical protein